MRIISRAVLGAVVLLGVTAAAVVGIGWHQGYRVYVVHTGSMMPTLRPGDAILDAPAPASVHPGEVIAFAMHSGPDSVVTHRVASISDGIVRTKGDANRTIDPWTLQLSQVVGTSVTLLPRVGFVIVYLKQPQGLASVIVLALAFTLLWQLFFPGQPSTSPQPASRHRSGRARHLASPGSVTG